MMTNWMRGCEDCTKFVEALKAARSDAIPIKEIAEAQDHLVTCHLPNMPDYETDCLNCQEWKILADHPEGIAPPLIPILGREDLLHRAGHLLFPLEGAAS